jgi:hypothetical protein
MANWDGGQVSNLANGQTLTCTTLNPGQLYGLFLYNAAGNDNNATLFVTVGNQPPKAVTVPGTTAGQGLATIVLVSGNDSTTVAVSMVNQPNAQVQCWIGSVRMPTNTTGLNNQPLPDNGTTQPFAQYDRYYAVPPSSWQALTITSSITQFISVQFQEYYATIYIVNPLPNAQAAVVTMGSVTSSNYTVVLAANPSNSIVQTFAGNGTQWVWMNADSSQNSSDATISLQPLAISNLPEVEELQRA